MLPTPAPNRLRSLQTAPPNSGPPFDPSRMWEQKDADVPFDPTTSVEKKEAARSGSRATGTGGTTGGAKETAEVHRRGGRVWGGEEKNCAEAASRTGRAPIVISK